MSTPPRRSDGEQQGWVDAAFVQVNLALWTAGKALQRAKMVAAVPAPSLSP
jgi:hypothetical protein